VATCWRLSKRWGSINKNFDANQGGNDMEKQLLTIMTWLLFLRGTFGFVMALIKTFSGGTPAEYGVMGIGGGLWYLFASITIYIRSKV
jgi:hypothetical protein